ncbi:MAG: hypothetical protein KJO40_12595 [Deltaproteobacteria bacterium]|nr:hypothetical protein [Deltaproteobacteria bacterium]NND28109.1 hypothetical protein [Myxococcales bacterium]MBT8465290.1 hypothetical protein [Deltaproteobacteria bacterium]MBT8481580.1 hypothetical protein [Deltaproteobacteria bacterium]NNK07171.1 hypothetical protein [Myxococcales bacterium]
MLRSFIAFLVILSCGCGGYTYVSMVHRVLIVEEQRVVVGQRTTTEVTETGEVVRVKDIHELQITYACRPT